MPDGSMVSGWYDKLVRTIAKVAAKPDKKNLQEEQSPPGAIYSRPAFEGHLAFGMDPGRLGAIIRGADGGDTREWFILAEEIEELYPHYHSVLSKRKRQVCQLPITVEAAGDEKIHQDNADLVRDWLRTDVLQGALFNVADGIGKSFSVCEIMWETTPQHFWPRELKYRKQSWFEVDFFGGEDIWLRTDQGFTELMQYKYLVHRHPAKSGGLVRSGLTRIVAFLWLYASYTLRDWAVFVQAYGLPIRVGRYGPEASDSDKRTLWRAVSSIAGDVAAMIPKSMEVEFVKGDDRTAGAQLFERRMDWLDREVSKVVLGSTAGTDAIAGGHAVGREHRQVEEDVERFDAALLSASITRQILVPMIDFTKGAPPDGNYPRLLIGRPDEIPLKDLIAGVADLAGAGLTVKADEIRGRLGLSKPDKSDEVIGGRPPAPEPKPNIPSLAVTPPENAELQTRKRWLGELISRHAQAPGRDLVDELTQRLADDAAGAMQGMTDGVRAVFESATDMHDLSHRLGKLQLNSQQFAEAMARGIALAQLVGQAALVDELRGSK